MQSIKNSRDDTPSDFRKVKRKRTYLTQRERFLQELSKFASDSDDSQREDAHITAEQCSKHSEMKAIAGNFFEQAAEDEEQYHRGLNKSAAPKRVGVSLIKSMHIANPSLVTSGLDSAADGKNVTDTHAREFKVVETYSPLTTGGFFESSMEPMDIRVVKLGDVMCLLSTISGNGIASPSVGSPTTGSSVYCRAERSSDGALTTQGGGVASRNGEVVDNNAVNSPSTAKAGSFEGFGELLTTARANKILKRFTAEVNLTEEEQAYGKKASVEMVNQLFEVTRLDRDNHALEGLFINGNRRVLRAHEVRLAGFVERKLYKKWKEDPSSQPVHTIDAIEPIVRNLKIGENSPRLSVSAEDSRAVPVDAQGGKDCGKQNRFSESSDTERAPVVWWVIPNLIVRIVAENAGKWYGKKCVVRAIDPKNNKVRLIRLDLWVQHQPLSPQEPLLLREEGVVEVVGVQGLETVLPKKGESGLIVLGPHRGEIASVITRLCGLEGNLVRLKVQCKRTGDVFEVEPHELCLMARRQ